MWVLLNQRSYPDYCRVYSSDRGYYAERISYAGEFCFEFDVEGV